MKSILEKAWEVLDGWLENKKVNVGWCDLCECKAELNDFSVCKRCCDGIDAQMATWREGEIKRHRNETEEPVI